MRGALITKYEESISKSSGFVSCVTVWFGPLLYCDKPNSKCSLLDNAVPEPLRKANLEHSTNHIGQRTLKPPLAYR
jgi:hypothetical protein